MESKKIKNIVLAALFIATGMVFPFLTGQIPEIGSMLLPMHIPVFLAGLIIGPFYGAGVGFLLPLLRCLIFTKPVLYPMAISMAFELATYAFVAGYLYYKSPWKCTKAVFKAMIPSMVAGRCVFGVVQAVLMSVRGNVYTIEAFVTGALIEAMPGIVIQLMLVPAVMVALKKAKLVPICGNGEKNAKQTD